MNIYSVYKGDNFIFLGTMREISEYLGITYQSAINLSSKSYIERRNKNNNALVAYRMED